jgi:hypothetical protein
MGYPFIMLMSGSLMQLSLGHALAQALNEQQKLSFVGTSPGSDRLTGSISSLATGQCRLVLRARQILAGCRGDPAALPVKQNALL